LFTHKVLGLLKKKFERAGSNPSLDKLLSDPLGTDYFMKYLSTAYCEENLLFWLEVEKYKKLDKDKPAKGVEIYERFIKSGSPMDIGMESQITKNIEQKIANKDFIPELYQEAQEKILFLLKANSYSRFLQSDYCKELVEISATEDGQNVNEPDQEDLMFARDERNVIKAGAVEKLVERLTYEKHSDLLFHRHFLLTYRSFMTQSDLIEKLWQRYL